MDTHVFVRISEADNGHKAKVVWNRGAQSFPLYTIDLGLLKDAAESIRKKLDTFVKVVIEQKNLNRQAEALREVADCGVKLRHCLFNAIEGKRDAESVNDWIARQGDKIRSIEFNVNERIHIPWGMVYDTDNAEIDEPRNPLDRANFSGFWALKYCTFTTYYRITPDGLTEEVDGRQIELISTVNSTVYDNVRTVLSENEAELVDKVLTCKGPLVKTKDELARRWEDNSTNSLLYFYCHADGKNLVLSDQKQKNIDLLDWTYLLHRTTSPSQGRSLAILNGCSTAIGSDRGGFLEATGSDDFFGFIGTEAAIPNLFALRFGTELVRRLLTSKQTLLEIVYEMRITHWPLSILYGVYCYPFLRVLGFAEQIVEVNRGNFSTQQIGVSSPGDDYNSSLLEVKL